MARGRNNQRYSERVLSRSPRSPDTERDGKAGRVDLAAGGKPIAHEVEYSSLLPSSYLLRS